MIRRRIELLYILLVYIFLKNVISKNENLIFNKLLIDFIYIYYCFLCFFFFIS